MIKQINSPNTVQNYYVPQMNTTFKANPVGKIKTLERTPIIDVVTTSSHNRALKPLLAFGAFILSGFGITDAIKAIKENNKKKAIQDIENKFADLQNNIPEVQYTFKKVFLRDDLTEQETREILERYKEVEKIRITGTKEEYINALFKEVKKNFGFEDRQIYLQLTTTGPYLGLCDPFNRYIMIHKNPILGLGGMVNTMHHEFRHAKQHELVWNLHPDSANKQFVDQIKEDSPKKYERIMKFIEKRNITDEDEITKLIIEHFPVDYEFNIVRPLGKLSPDNIPHSQKPFADALVKHYCELDYDKFQKSRKYYRATVTEADARFAGESMAKLFGKRLIYNL